MNLSEHVKKEKLRYARAAIAEAAATTVVTAAGFALQYY